MKNLLKVLVVAIVISASMHAQSENALPHIEGLEAECAHIDFIYKELERLTRDGKEVVYVTREGVFETPAHQLNIYKFCYDVNVERSADQKALLARYNAQKAYDAVGRVMREVPHHEPLYDQCARQTGMIIETIACGLAPYPECGGVLTGIAEIYARMEADKK